MDTVTDTISSTATSSVDVVKKTSSDVIQFKFYKNPIFLSFMVYCIFLFVSYAYLDDKIKNSYVFSNKFRDSSNDIHFTEIIKYPYDFKSVPSIIKIIFTSPLILYVVFFSILFSNFVDIKGSQYSSYFYSVMFSYFFLLILFSIHVLLIKYLVKPQTIKIESELNRDDGKDREKTYEAFYRTQWVFLAFLSPIFVTIMVYFMRKINNYS